MMIATNRIPVLFLLLFGFSFDCHGVMTIRPVVDQTHGGHRGGPKTFQLNGFENSRLTLIKPGLEQKPITTKQGRFALRPTGIDNYHALVAEREHNGVKESAIRYVYFNGKPSGASPSQLTDLKKTDLEIVPDPLPREHWHYKSGDRIGFNLRWKGEPVANTSVTLATSQSSILQSETNAQGKVWFVLPDDFSEQASTHSGPAELLVHARLNHAQTPHATWLSAEYFPDPQRWRDHTLGLIVSGGGFLFGAYITGLGFRQRARQVT